MVKRKHLKKQRWKTLRGSPKKQKVFKPGASLISWNIGNFLRVGFFHFSSSGSYFLKYKRNMRLESFISVSQNIRKFFRKRFWWLGLKSALGIFIDVWQCSEYASGSEYTRVLNMLLVLNMSEFWICLSWNTGKTLLRK